MGKDIINEPLVSVLIPSYNHENYVQNSIKSIIEQSYKNIELIIIDDGSTDNTWSKILEMKEECEKRFANCVFQTKENEGTCKTFNKLLDLAKGEFIYIIASDDISKPNAIESEIEFLTSHKDYSLCVGDNELIDENGKICFWDEKRNTLYDETAPFKTFAQYLGNKERKDVKFNSKEFGSYNSLTLGNYIPNGYLIRKSIFDLTGKFTHEAPLEDYWLMLQISKFSKIKFIPQVLFSYRWHSANTIRNNEKMVQIENKTKEYEKTVIENLVKSTKVKNTTRSFKQYVKYGFCYKKYGLPYILEILKFKKDGKKSIVLKFLDIQLFKIEKRSKNV